jgi:hypothetical protein
MTPNISQFFGITISMYYDDHNPPHFHASYQNDEVKILIKNFSLLEGTFPPKAFALTIEWAMQHQEELLQNWNNMVHNNQLAKIDPLE